MSDLLSDYDYELPRERIAQRPAPDRHGSRLLGFDTLSGATADHRFDELPSLLRAGDLLVVNDTRVLPARLLGHRAHPGGASAEILPHSPGADGRWQGLVRPSKRFKIGDRFVTGDQGVEVAVEEPAEE